MGADSRTSNGSYVANKAADKLTQLADRVYICRSGSAADTQAISSYVQHFLNQHGMESGEPVTVKNAAMAVRTIAYQNKANLMAGMIVDMVAAAFLAMILGIRLDLFLATTAIAYMISASLHHRGHGSWPLFGDDAWACWL